MAWLQQRPQVSDPVNYISVGLNKTVLVVGLGNVGSEYEGTRHNIGFAAVDAFAASSGLSAWVAKKDLKCNLSDGRVGETRVICIKPSTYMNLSGEAVQAVVHFYKIPLDYVVVVHDELDVVFGQIRSRVGGSSAGHNGVKSISKSLGDDNYGRLRIGIGPKSPEQIDSADFVLQRFNQEEQAHLPALLKEITAMLSEFAYGNSLNAETRSFLF